MVGITRMCVYSQPSYLTLPSEFIFLFPDDIWSRLFLDSSCLAGVSVLVRVTVAVIKHHDQSKLGRKGCI